MSIGFAVKKLIARCFGLVMLVRVDGVAVPPERVFKACDWPADGMFAPKPDILQAGWCPAAFYNPSLILLDAKKLPISLGVVPYPEEEEAPEQSGRIQVLAVSIPLAPYEVEVADRN